jgi:hypothetical protein
MGSFLGYGAGVSGDALYLYKSVKGDVVQFINFGSKLIN